LSALRRIPEQHVGLRAPEAVRSSGARFALSFDEDRTAVLALTFEAMRRLQESEGIALAASARRYVLEQFGVRLSVVTIGRAIEQLERDGYLTWGRGHWVVAQSQTRTDGG